MLTDDHRKKKARRKKRKMSEENRIKVVYVEPGRLATVREIGTELPDLQAAVGGWIETYYPFEEEVCIVCDDEGKFDGAFPNRAVRDADGKIMDIIFGPFFICDCSGEEFCSLSDEQIRRYKEMFRLPERFGRVDGEIVAVQYDPRSRGFER